MSTLTVGQKISGIASSFFKRTDPLIWIRENQKIAPTIAN